MEHQWLTDGPAADHTARSREAMLSLVEAVMPVGEAAAVMHMRIEAKVAQAALLSRARFAQDPVAARQADRLIGGCLGLLGQS